MGGLLRRTVGGQLLGGAEALVRLVLAEQAVSRPSGRVQRCIWRYGPKAPRSPRSPTAGPSSHSRPSQCSPSRMSRSYSTVERATSVSSRRRMKVPPCRRAKRIVEQRRAGGADVQRPRRAGRDPAADGHAGKCARGRRAASCRPGACGAWTGTQAHPAPTGPSPPSRATRPGVRAGVGVAEASGAGPSSGALLRQHPGAPRRP